MPLTNVWAQDQTGEWVRTTAAAMDREYDYSVSVSSRTFRCYNCFQYVTFVKGTEYRISHFKHSRGEEDKDCEDRSTGTGGFLQDRVRPGLRKRWSRMQKAKNAM